MQAVLEAWPHSQNINFIMLPNMYKCLPGCKLVIDGNCAGGLKTADSNISCVKGTIPCRQSVSFYLAGILD